jgi:hypothetical protein
MSSKHATASRNHVPTLPTMDINHIDSPGAYILHCDGLLMRIPPEAIKEDGAGWSITAKKPVQVSRISDNPWIAIGTARELAGKNHLPANF